MARIRSIHPGLFTDADFCRLSHEAALLFIGILTQCDDSGVFKADAVELKIRLLPLSPTVDAQPLIDEICNRNKAKLFDHNGHAYGVVRNFVDWQRPKKPRDLFPKPDWWGTYARSNDKSSEPTPRNPPPSSPPQPPKQPKTDGSVPHHPPTSGEKVQQKGGREEGRKEGDPPVRPPVPVPHAEHTRLPDREAKPWVPWLEPVRAVLLEHWPDHPTVATLSLGLCAQWQADGWDLHWDVLPTMERMCGARRAKGREPPSTLMLFSDAIAERHRERLAAAARNGKAGADPPAATPEEADALVWRGLWSKWLTEWNATGRWPTGAMHLTHDQAPPPARVVPPKYCPQDLWDEMRAKPRPRA